MEWGWFFGKWKTTYCWYIKDDLFVGGIEDIQFLLLFEDND